MNNIKVIIDSSHKNSSLLYAADFYCIDTFIFIDTPEKKIGWLPSTELEKAKRYSKLTEIKNLTFELENLNKKKIYPCLKSSLVIDWLNKNDIQEIFVPENFPIIDADNLRKFGITVNPIQEPFYKSRVIKSKEEISYIKDNSKKNVTVMKEVYTIIGESSITNDNKLEYNGEILTSEFLQDYILKSFIDKNLSADAVIVSIGDQACFPHEYGTGELYANTSIIVDIFPRNRSNLYFTDMTRTFCKGKASEDLKKIYNTVYDAQRIALDKIYANVDGRTLHRIIQQYFIDKGFKTGVINGVLQGFFHGTGHGVGLDCHEFPFISVNGTKLPDNSIVTVEPGLYYLGKGAARIEDLVLVTKNGVENLTNYEKILEIE